MIRFLVILMLTCACVNTHAQVNYITTIAGKAGVPSSDSGDGGPATNCRFYGPYAVCLDKTGNIYICDGYNGLIRKINVSDGIITTIGGVDSFARGGIDSDGIQATNAILSLPNFIVLDSAGNIYFTDSGNERVRKITVSTGIITTIAGTKNWGYSGDGGPATDAEFNAPVGICIDKHNNIFVSDYSNDVIRKIDTNGIITTVVGKMGGFSYSGDGGPATNALLAGPIDVFTDTADNLYFTDLYNEVVRRVDAKTGIITTIIGNGTTGYSGDGGLAINAQMNQPSGGMIDQNNNIYIAEFGNGVVRRIDGITGIITTVAGNGTWGYTGDGGPATAAELSSADIAFDNSGCMIIADYGTNTIRKVYNTATGVSNLPLRQNRNVQIYPNPAKESITIENATGSYFEMFDILGKEILSDKINSNKETVNLQRLSPGICLFRIVAANGEIINKIFVKE